MEEKPAVWFRPVAVLAAIPIYVLSVGPAVWLFDRMGWNASTLELVYAPLVWLYEHNSVAARLLEAYIELFQ
ncbi:MAG: hypothetical protein AB1758_27815 [Candidatus Eremiobacterota bacterium]